ncbi:hypothetical protein [Engelhardtia mirabilis]|uniref:Uncharacterized protein n=1 Tax=Engelhardtia mirabilis TaxID=2528011 RepID=A0A518BL25_9BACT|nr:hypothetical protein Pla133_27680 [Planctomycetes bacterium Pla133]QDV02006.1 hypothetical protein Pla86_27670 [Planctomycetes bacterium Pla86]
MNSTERELAETQKALGRTRGTLANVLGLAALFSPSPKPNTSSMVADD